MLQHNQQPITGMKMFNTVSFLPPITATNNKATMKYMAETLTVVKVKESTRQYLSVIMISIPINYDDPFYRTQRLLFSLFLLLACVCCDMKSREIHIYGAC